MDPDADPALVQQDRFVLVLWILLKHQATAIGVAEKSDQPSNLYDLSAQRQVQFRPPEAEESVLVG